MSVRPSSRLVSSCSSGRSAVTPRSQPAVCASVRHQSPLGPCETPTGPRPSRRTRNRLGRRALSGTACRSCPQAPSTRPSLARAERRRPGPPRAFNAWSSRNDCGGCLLAPPCRSDIGDASGEDLDEWCTEARKRVQLPSTYDAYEGSAITRRLRRIAKPMPPKPATIIAHVVGSGTLATSWRYSASDTRKL